MAGIKAYERELKARLRDSDRWPQFTDSAFLDRLDRLASNSITKGSREGCLAAILIYHQLAEEMIRLLLRDAQFLVQLSLFPSRITFPERKNQLFGHLLQELEDSVDFEGKRALLERTRDLNSIRIKIVHKLPRRGSLKGLTREAHRAQILYEKAFVIFDRAHDNFRVAFREYMKDAL